MGDFLYSIDLSLFNFINHTIANPVFDKFFPFITNLQHWIIAYVILMIILYLNGGRKGKIAFWGIIIVIAVSDQISSNLLKHYFQRIRPCNFLDDVRLLVGATSSYSFPSSHAVNNFAAAVFFLKLFPKYKWIYFVIAALLAFSRPYVGVHYPSDIIAGAIIGALIGYAFGVLALKLDLYIANKKL